MSLREPPLRRAFDLVASAAGVVVLAPLLLSCGACVLLFSGRPVLFRQTRAGRDGRPFEMLKFRTMVLGAEGGGIELARDDARVTPPGRWLRALSLDELPQLGNVLRGEMSIVGPRPTVPAQADRYDASQRRRLDVLPGITGWAQVNGRNSVDWRTRIEMDVWYVEHRSPGLDLRILLRTPFVVIGRSGLTASDGTVRGLEER